jgi:CRISPR-associated protein Csx16
MMALFVTRHSGDINWAKRQVHSVRIVSHLNPLEVGQGDIVMGTVPVHLAAVVCARGARYFHLSLDIQPEMRGHNLSCEEMIKFGARLTEYTVEAKGGQ